MRKKIFNTILGFGISLMALSSPKNDTLRPHGQLPGQPPIKTIIIDAGHGLPDPGTQGKYSNESDIALAVALKLQKKLQDSFPGVTVLMTRTDRNLPNGLTNKNVANRWRAQFANENKGDLYISIHVNDGGVDYHHEITGYDTETYTTGKGRKKKKHTRKVPVYRRWTTPNPVKGTETYIWAVDKNDSKTSFVHSADQGVEFGEKGDSSFNYFDSPEAKIAASMRTRKYFERSRMLATFVENAFIQMGRPSRGVKQRNDEGIWVLQATAMPSILVETGFIGAEEDYLNSIEGQEEVSNAVLTAVQQYQHFLQRNITTLPPEQARQQPKDSATAPRMQSTISGMNVR